MFDKNNIDHIEKLKRIIEDEKKENGYGYWEKATKKANEEFDTSIGFEAWRSTYKKYVLPLRSEKESLEDTKTNLLKLIKAEKDIEQLEKYFEMTKIEILGIVEELKLSHYNIQVYKVDDDIKIKLGKSDIEDNELRLPDVASTITLGVVSDTHLCSKWQQLELLHKTYDLFQERGIDTVLHAGDISDGFYKDRLGSIFMLGFDDQADYVVNAYPKREGMTTYFLTGNHDYTHQRNGMADIGRVIADRRSDMIYLGQDRATVNINKCEILLMHPQDGSSYAYSYRGQKHLDVIRGGKKPNVVLCGHHHKLFYMLYRNIHYFEVPSFQDRTPFTDGKGLSNDVGAWIITIKLDTKGNVVSILPEAIPYYNTKNNDYNNKYDNYMKMNRGQEKVMIKK